MSNAKRSVIVLHLHICLDYTLVAGTRPHVDLRYKISINLKSAHEITLRHHRISRFASLVGLMGILKVV